MSDNISMTIEGRQYNTAETLIEIYGKNSLSELLDDSICPACGNETNNSMGDYTIMVKAECTFEDCDFGFCDTRQAIDELM